MILAKPLFFIHLLIFAFEKYSIPLAFTNGFKNLHDDTSQVGEDAINGNLVSLWTARCILCEAISSSCFVVHVRKNFPHGRAWAAGGKQMCCEDLEYLSKLFSYTQYVISKVLLSESTFNQPYK